MLLSSGPKTSLFLELEVQGSRFQYHNDVACHPYEICMPCLWLGEDG